MDARPFGKGENQAIPERNTKSPQEPSDPNSLAEFGQAVRRPPAFVRFPSGFFLGLQDLTALVHAALEVEVVRAAEFAGILVLDVSGLLERVRRAAHATARRRGFSAGNGHFRKSSRGIGEASPGA